MYDVREQLLGVSVDIQLETNLAMRFQIEPIHIGSQSSSPVVRQDFSPPARRKASEALREIRDEMGLTNHSFAQMLGIGHSTLSSYLYGRVLEVPESLVQHARAIADKTADERYQPRARFLAEATMMQIVEDWMVRLGGDPTESQTAAKGRMQELAEVIKVHKTTLWRWQQPETGEKSMRPTLERIRRYDADVLQAAAAKAAALASSQASQP
jgi:transcriptional regulator with XRE-family HTH domain